MNLLLIRYALSILKEQMYFSRVIYDLLFYFLVNIITLNLIFGVIIDTFGNLREEKQEKDYILRNTCFICGNLLKLESPHEQYILIEFIFRIGQVHV